MQHWQQPSLKKSLLFGVGILSIPCGMIIGHFIGDRLVAPISNRFVAAIAAGIVAGAGMGAGYYVAYFAASSDRRKHRRLAELEVVEGKRCAWSWGLFQPGDRKFPYPNSESGTFVCEEAAKRLGIESDLDIHH
ncbi:MAG: hypothetical protein WC058_09675 [Phycisphaeraceae bacterium]